MTLLYAIKKIACTGGSDNLKAHNKAMSHISFMGIHQEKFQDIQDFRDLYMALCKEMY